MTLAETGLAGLRKLDDQPFDLMLLDVSLPDRNGIEMLREIRQRDPHLAIILITAYGSIDMAREAFKSGAQDYITKPWSNDELIAQISLAIEGRRLREENVHLKRALKQRYNFPNIVGKSEKMLAVLDLVTQVAPSRSTVLISGESGTGKEVIAKAIHFASTRADKAFIPINTGSIPVDLLESQLFGHVKGAFTSAVASKKGLFEVADQGTIFFDEISTVSPETQAKLLRVIQEREFMRLGGTETIKVDVRILAASNEDLRKLVREGRFREDLFHRLERDFDSVCRRCASARKIFRCWSARFLEQFCRDNSKPARAFTNRRDETADGLRLARQHSRTGKCRGARRGAFEPGIHGCRAAAGKRAHARNREGRAGATGGIFAAAAGRNRLARIGAATFAFRDSRGSRAAHHRGHAGAHELEPDRSGRALSDSALDAQSENQAPGYRNPPPAGRSARWPGHALRRRRRIRRREVSCARSAFSRRFRFDSRRSESQDPHPEGVRMTSKLRIRLTGALRIAELGDELSAGDIFEDSIRREIAERRAFGRDQESLFERELPGHRRVRYAVGEHQPSRKRRKLQMALRAILLKVGVLLQDNRGSRA